MLWSLQKWCAASHLWTATQHFSFIMQLAIHSEETGSAPFFVKGKTKAVQSFTIAELCNKVQNAITNSKQGQMLLKGCYSWRELNAGSNGTTARPSKPKFDFLLAFEWCKNLHSPTGVDLMLWSLQKWCAASHLWTATQHFSFIMQLAIHSEETGSAPFFVKGKTKAVQSFTIAELCNKVQNAITNSKQGQMLLKGCYSWRELNAGSNGTTARPSKPKFDFLLAFEWGQKLT